MPPRMLSAESGLDENNARELVVDTGHRIPRDELDVRASRAGGPGGQHVNMTSSKVEVRWKPAVSRAFSPEERERVSGKLASRLDSDGVLRVVSRATRSQRRNRDDAEARLAALVRQALVVPKPRRKTRRPKAAQEARLSTKRRQSERKRDRRTRDWE